MLGLKRVFERFDDDTVYPNGSDVAATARILKKQGLDAFHDQALREGSPAYLSPRQAQQISAAAGDTALRLQSIELPK